MAVPEYPRDHIAAQELARAAELLHRCISEQYTSHGNIVLHHGNSVVSLSVELDEKSAAAVAAGIEAIIGPVRRKDALRRIAEIEQLLAEIKALQRDADA
jgi:hypothetical protein